MKHLIIFKLRHRDIGGAPRGASVSKDAVAVQNAVASALGISLLQTSVWAQCDPDGITRVLCTPEEFSDFLIFRNNNGGCNRFKEIEPKIVEAIPDPRQIAHSDWYTKGASRVIADAESVYDIGNPGAQKYGAPNWATHVCEEPSTCQKEGMHRININWHMSPEEVDCRIWATLRSKQATHDALLNTGMSYDKAREKSIREVAKYFDKRADDLESSLQRYGDKNFLREEAMRARLNAVTVRGLI